MMFLRATEPDWSMIVDECRGKKALGTTTYIVWGEKKKDKHRTWIEID